MNRHFYRIVFNKVRGMLMIVAEIAKGHQGPSSGTQKAERIINTKKTTVSLKPLVFLTYVALGMVTLSTASYANNIIVDKNADKSQRPTTHQTANGVTQINIQEASKAGVSHNKYTQFDVSGKGVILNNSSQISNTQLAGYIKGNDNLLRSGSAKVILNEVNSKDASKIAGYIEVAGQKAQVIIANPAGITCNGCGFINADRATLTTGKPIMENGALKGYQVEKGNITINGKGLDSSQQNYTDLIARSVNINASLWANDATVITGKNKVSADLKQIDKQADDGQAKPQLAMDVSSLGGMYAGKIQMIGTESGVGVHNAGHLGASAGGITLTADGKIVNSGTIQAKQDIAIRSQQDINNQSQIYAQGNATLTAKANITNSGTIQAKQNIAMSSQQDIHNQAKIYAQGNATLTAKSNIDNQSTLIAGHHLDLQAKKVNNDRQAVAAAGVDDNGQLTQNGNLTLNAEQATLNGRQLSHDTASLVVNHALDMKDSQNHFGQLAIQSDDIDTQNSVFNIERNAALVVGDWNNRQSSFRVGQALNANAKNIINSEAILFAGDLTLDADSLTGDGKLLADSSLTLTLQQDFLNQSEVMSSGDVSIYTLGNITNASKMIAGNTLKLHAHDIYNQQAAQIESSIAKIEGNNLINTGLINSDDLTIIMNDTLNNYNAGTLYGNDIHLTAKTLNNQAQTSDAAPAIAARNKLTIAADTVNNINHALLLSLGDLEITAKTVNNHSSKIESSGDMILTVDTLNNINDLIETEEVLVSTDHVVEYSPEGSSVRYKPDEVKTYTSPKKRHRYLMLESLNGAFETKYKFTLYDYDVKHYETQVTHTDPAEIIAGGNLTINATHVENDNSKIIAGNALAIHSVTLNNTSLQGIDRTTSDGKSYFHKRKKKHSMTGKASYSQKKESSDYHDEVVKTLDLATAKIEEHQIINANNTSINGPTTVHVDSGSVGLVEPNITLPNNSIYLINKDVEKNYVIETDPKFTNKKKWLSSDYMFEQLKADPNNIQKRLGDGYYEQQLIREQITTLTGQRYLGDYTSDLTQYQNLMNAGVTFAEHYGLAIGVALSPAQMEALTTDIVWMVSKTVMVDGQPTEVLVPQVYVVNRPTITTEGALLAGKNVELKTERDITTSGTVAAKNDITMNVNNLTNLGQMSADKITVVANDTITSHGSISGDKLVSLSAKNDIDLASTTSTTSTYYGKNKSINTVIDKVSSVQVKDGDIKLSAGHDVNLDAALIINNSETGKTDIAAGNDINLSTVETKQQQDIIWNKNDYKKTATQKVVGTEIISQGEVNLNAGHDIAVNAGSISADKSLNLSAGNDIKIESASEREQLTENSKETSKGFLSKGSTTTHIEVDNTTQQGSSLSGETVNIKAGNDLNITGSQVTSTNDMNLAAGGDVNIDAAEESYYNKTETVTKKSGLMSSGSLGVTVGKEKTDLKKTNTQQGYQASTIGSTDGNVNITAGKDISVKGSDVIAKQDINLKGENVTIAANDSETKYKEEYKYEKSGLTLAITGTAADLYDAKKAIDNAKKKDNDTILALQAIKSGLTTANAGLDIYGAANGAESTSQASIGVSASFGSEKTKRTTNEEQHSVVGSGVSAGQNINIIATGDEHKNGGNINVIGSEVKAGQDITLNANQDVNVIGAVNTQHRDMDEKSSSSSVGVGFSVGTDKTGWTFSGSTSFTHERENANGSAWSEAIIDAGNNLTIHTGNDANIIGGQVSGETVKADIGNNLNIESLQDSDNYDYKKLSTSVGGSYTYGAGGAQLNASLGKTTMESNWASVTDQSGIYAGSGGYDITVGNNTDLKGAVIASDAADKTKNMLNTGTISFEDIKNKADYKVDSTNVNVGLGHGNGIGYTPSASAPSVYHNDGSDSSITKSAVEGGMLIVRDTENQQQDVNTLSRDTANANNPLGQIFDKQKEQDRIDSLNLVKDITAQAKDVANKYGSISAELEYNASSGPKRDELDDKAAKSLKEQGIDISTLTKEEREKVLKDESVRLIAKDKDFGNMGDSFSKGLDAASSIVSGIITGDVTGGLAGASAPYLAGVIKEQTGDDYVANKIAHAILGGAIAAAQGNSALAGAGGAAGGEVIADIIRKELYGNRDPKDLTESEKQNISNLTQLALGLGTAASGGSTSDVGAAMAGGKNAVENNDLSPPPIIPIGEGTIQVAGATGEVTKEVYSKCGDSCTPEDYKKAFQDAGLENRFEQFTEAQRKAIYMIPLAGWVYGGFDSIKEGDITPLLQAGISQTEIGGIIMVLYRNQPNAPTKSQITQKVKDAVNGTREQITNPATNTVVTEHIIVPSGKAPHTSTPNSIYEVSRADGSRSITYYDDKGRMFSREDYGQQRTHGELGYDSNGKVPSHEHKTTYKTYNGKDFKDKKYYRVIDENGKPVGPWILEK